ncbi:cyclic nucleotide-binding domain-containing protein [Chelatococcus daeguensis]|uniref:Cyclic nucleotide-binding protein n=2 Tax=Chelatococcus TaxID=28209 RepID=A0AAC9JRW5_9HYPH|nr:MULTISPECIES: cyclic nucleotide-binding domain-containing protein [Chelatococcus]APF36032.1 cyclic nucleotide-binding protein [Chelatococcus daeguensis]KZE34673.1 cyclic nucleotide-binding protein [Chelatococcus daeguensis]MBM3082505.1 cyclic nucleotide-binding domain-containing protein [Chelatococcus daeguensis]CUA88655.1 Cyclic nucleotide-binding domain [Chelatococcus sambhunathii]
MGLNEDIAALEAVPTFAGVEREALRLIAFAAESRILRAGDVLFRRGEPADGGYLVRSGAIALDARDDGSPTDHVVGPGVLIGELALFAETKRPATAIAREPSSVTKLPRSVLRRVLVEFPDVAVHLRAIFAERLNGIAADLAAVRRSLLSIER